MSRIGKAHHAASISVWVSGPLVLPALAVCVNLGLSISDRRYLLSYEGCRQKRIRHLYRRIPQMWTVVLAVTDSLVSDQHLTG